MANNYRPRINRRLRDRVLEVGEELNGQEPQSYQEALEKLVRYFGILQHRVPCPQCGAEDTNETVAGKYECWRCAEDRDSGYFTVWDVLDPADKEQASLPALPNGVHLRFECNHEEHTSGSDGTKNTSNADIQQGQRLNSQQNQWDNGF